MTVRALGLASALALALAGCAAKRAPPVTPAAVMGGSACIADAIPRGALDRSAPSACKEPMVCARACDGGDREACVALAYALERLDDDEAEREAARLFAITCIAGHMNACTNFAATKRLGKAGLRPEPACETKVFERTCMAGEPWGCGMFGGALLAGDGTPKDLGRARAVLEASCLRFRTFPCRILGLAEREGTFGRADEPAATRAFQRACDAGDDASCGLVEGGPAERGPSIDL